MIELRNDSLLVSFPEVHPLAAMTITFEKAFRAARTGLEASKLSTGAKFPLKHIDDYAEKIPDALLKRGGVILPMHQSEALAIRFMPHKAQAADGSLYKNDDDKSWYPFIVAVGCGLINAVSGGGIKDKLSANPQNYLFIEEPATLYGMNDRSGATRQFIASPLGKGITVEEQLTGSAEYGGIQLIISPLKKKTFEEHYALQFSYNMPQECGTVRSCVSKAFSLAERALPRPRKIKSCRDYYCEDLSMGISHGERICSTFNDDIYELADWDRKHYSRCFTHILNSEAWREITGEEPEATALSEEQYRRHGVSWKQEYNEK